jgi:hypothetical protein
VGAPITRNKSPAKNRTDYRFGCAGVERGWPDALLPRIVLRCPHSELTVVLDDLAWLTGATGRAHDPHFPAKRLAQAASALWADWQPGEVGDCGGCPLGRG